MAIKLASRNQTFAVLCLAVCMPLLAVGCSRIQLEPSMEWFEEAGLDHGPYSVSVGDGGPGNPIMALHPGWHGTKVLTIRNYGDLADSYTIEVRSSSPLIRVPDLPQTLSLQPGETYEVVLGIDVPLDQPDGPIGSAHVVVTSQICPNNLASCNVEVRSKTPAITDSLANLDYLAGGLRDSADDTPLVSGALAAAAQDVEAARSSLVQASPDRAAAVNSLYEAMVLVGQSMDQLAESDAQSGTSTYEEAIGTLNYWSMLLVTVARREAPQVVVAAEAAGADPALITAAWAKIHAGDEAFGENDYVEAVAQYVSALVP